MLSAVTSSTNHRYRRISPFEGDAILSIILSNAFRLADDTKITDETSGR